MRSGTPLTQGLLGLLSFALLCAALLTLSRTPEERALRTGGGSSLARGPKGLSRLFAALENCAVPIRRLRSGSFPEGDNTQLIIEPKVGAKPELLEELQLRLAENRDLLCVVFGTEDQLRPFEVLLEAPEPGRIRGGEGVDSAEFLPYHPTRLLLRSLDGSSDPVLAFDSLPPGATPWIWSHSGQAFVFEVRIGRASIVMGSDPRILENQWLADGDNLLASLATLAGRKTIVFDERWQNPGADGAQPMMGLLYGTALGRGGVVLALLLMLSLWFRGLSLGGPDPQLRRPRPLSAFVASLAARHLAAPRPEGLSLIFRRRFHRRASRLLGVESDRPSSDVCRALELRCGLSAEEARSLLAPSTREAELARQVTRMDEILRDLEGLRTQPRKNQPSPSEEGKDR